MDLRQLAALVAVAEHGSFSAAADALATVQSNVSTHVKNLERELGSVLVDRSSGQLTDAGALVVDRARRVMRELDSLTSEVTALGYEVVGTVRVGAIGTTARWIVPRLLDVTPTRHPRLRAAIFVEATTQGLDAQLASGHVDLGVLALPASGSEVRTIPLFEEDLGLVVPSTHPLASRSEIKLHELAQVPLILPLRGVSYRDTLDKALHAGGVTLRPRAEFDSVRLLASLTFDGGFYSILPSGAVPSFLADELTLVPIEGLPPRVVGVAYRRRGMPGTSVRAVLEILAEIVADGSQLPKGIRPILSSPVQRPSNTESAEPTDNETGETEPSPLVAGASS